MTRVAAVDLGTNSTRLLVADVDGDTLDEVLRLLTITRLGEGVDERHKLLPVPIARVRNCLADYRRELEALGAERTLAIATSAVRDAENGEAFLGEIEWSYGFTTELLAGTEEAAMMLRGVTSGRPALDDVLVVDIGGGSTELVHAVGRRRRLRHEPRRRLRAPHRALSRLRPAVASGARRSRPDTCARSFHRSRSARAIGVAGTVTTLATLDLGDSEYDPARTHGHRISRASAETQLERLAALSVEERRLVGGIEPGRAPVIVAGLIVLREVLAAYDLAEIEVSERDILHGAALAAAELPEPEEGAAPPGAYTCC